MNLSSVVDLLIEFADPGGLVVIDDLNVFFATNFHVWNGLI